MIETMNPAELDNRISEFLLRKGQQFPELHLKDADYESSPRSEPRGTSVWFKEIHNTKTI